MRDLSWKQELVGWRDVHRIFYKDPGEDPSAWREVVEGFAKDPSDSTWKLFHKNELPTITILFPRTTSQIYVGREYTLKAAINDPDGTIASASIGLTDGITDTELASFGGGGPYEVAWTPSTAQAETVYFEATDNDGETARTTVDITVQANPPPSISGINSWGLVEGTSATTKFTVKDEIDHDVLALAVTGLPGGFTHTITDLGAEYEVQVDYDGSTGQGSYSFDITADDQTNPVVTKTVSVTINAPASNNPPIIGGPSTWTVEENTADSIVIEIEDDDTDTLTITIPELDSSPPTGFSYSVAADPSPPPGKQVQNVTISWDGTGTGGGSHTFTVTADDGTNTVDYAVSVDVVEESLTPPTITGPSTWSFDENTEATETWDVTSPNPIVVTVPEIDDGTQTELNYSVSNISGGKRVTVTSDVPLAEPASFNITITAEDGQNTVTQAVAVTINDVDEPPGVSILSPGNGQNIVEGSTIDIEADATDADGSVTTVEYRQNAGSWVAMDFVSGDRWEKTGVLLQGTAGSTTTIEVRATDDQALTTTASITVNVVAQNDPPVADFTWNANGRQVQFTEQASDPDGKSDIVSYSWNFNDGNSSTQQDPTHLYATDNTYYVSLTVTDSAGNSDTITKQVTVTNAPPSLNAYISDKTFLEIELRYYNVSDVEGDVTQLGINWGEGPGGTTILSPPSSGYQTHTYGSAGTYNISVTATDEDGATTTVNLSVTVEESQPPSVTSHQNTPGTEIIPGESFAFASEVTDNNRDLVTVSWQVEDPDSPGFVQVDSAPGDSSQTTKTYHGSWSPTSGDERGYPDAWTLRIVATDADGNTDILVPSQASALYVVKPPTFNASDSEVSPGDWGLSMQITNPAEGGLISEVRFYVDNQLEETKSVSQNPGTTNTYNTIYTPSSSFGWRADAVLTDGKVIQGPTSTVTV